MIKISARTLLTIGSGLLTVGSFVLDHFKEKDRMKATAEEAAKIVLSQVQKK